MFCRFTGETEKGGPENGTAYWLEFTNDATLAGHIHVGIPAFGRKDFPVWKAKYNSFEEFTENWEIV